MIYKLYKSDFNFIDYEVNKLYLDFVGALLIAGNIFRNVIMKNGFPLYVK